MQSGAKNSGGSNRRIPPPDRGAGIARAGAAAKAGEAWNADARSRAIADVAPFSGWPADAVQRLAAATRVRRYRRGHRIVSRGDWIDAVHLVVEGSTSVGLTDPNGRAVVFTIHPPRERIHGIGSLVDGVAMPNDVTADEPATVLAIPIAAVRGELARAPVLWESVAIEVTARARAFVDEVRALLLRPLRPRLVGLLLWLATSSGTRSDRGTVANGPRLPQERLGEMLGVSRQTVTGLVRELAGDGLVHWRYGRVTLLDLERLQAIAAEGAQGRR